MDFNKQSMRKVAMMVMFVTSLSMTHAQTFNEWFKQKKTQIEYLVDQIAALKAYGAVVNKGYEIAGDGLAAIFYNKDGDYRQHSDYFISLRSVKRGIKNYSKLPAIDNMKGQIEKQARQLLSVTTEFLTAGEKNYINRVCTGLVEKSKELATETAMIRSDDRLPMKDDERIQRVDKAYLEMQDLYRFSVSVTNGVRSLVVSRRGQAELLNRLSSLYGSR
ncbi:MAG: hypothetical protein ACTHMD_12940 [Flavisolibacter sp.]